jgi:flagellar biosynthetic protein FlhB
MPEQDGDKTQDPTPHRRQEAREHGEVARSQDLASAAVLVTGLALLYMWIGTVTDFFGGLTSRQLGGGAWLQTDSLTIVAQLREVLWLTAKAIGPFLAFVLLTAVAANLFQFGLLWLPEKLMPELSRLDLLAAFGRIFSVSNLVKLGFGLLKLILVASIAYNDVSGQVDEIVAATALPVPQLALFLLTTLFWTTFRIASALLILALIDYFYQWWKHEQDLKMTTQEIREEMKNMQGDPQIIARRRQVQRQLVANRLKGTVPKADVVVTNPTELAVALQYNPAEMAAPIVLAKGAGVLAARIRQIALENGIPIVEKKPLAQALYKDVDVGRPIPGALYSAVAEIMAYVYQLKGKSMPPRNAA